MLYMTRFEPRAHQGRDEAPQETVQIFYALPQYFLGVPKPLRMQNLGGS